MARAFSTRMSIYQRRITMKKFVFLSLFACLISAFPAAAETVSEGQVEGALSGL